MNSKEKKIGFVGVGRMGANRARNLRDKGYTISCVNDVNKDAASTLASELGCAHAENLAEVTSQSDIVLTVVTNDAAMESIFFGADDNLLRTHPIPFSSTVPPFPLQCMSDWRMPPPRMDPPRSKAAWPQASRRLVKEPFI